MELVKFREMPYSRPDTAAAAEELKKLAEALRSAASFEEADEIFLKKQELEKHIFTAEELAHIRHTIDAHDAFYEEEIKFWNKTMPELKEYMQHWTAALLASPFRKEFSEKYGEIMFLNAEIEMKAFSPEIIPEMQEEAELTDEYNKLIASAQIPFRGGVYTIPQMSLFKNDADDEIRLEAWKAEGNWYNDNLPKLDEIYDKLVHLRDAMGRKMGFDGYTRLGYYRMNRNCYGKKEVERFREAVRKHIVPIAERLYRAQAERIGVPYPMSFSDAQLKFRSGNPKPAGGPDDILAAGDAFYDELSPETSEFFRVMRKYELMDVLSKEGKRQGGYCTLIPDYEVPFIFANFNGTQHDVEVVTHEAGHAFEAYINRKRLPVDNVFPSLEACEVHSMSMEFFAWPWAERFFGKEADKFRFSHLASSLAFIPYGTMVDHFQHIIYEKPELTAAERHGVWKELLGVYMPHLRLDGDIPVYAEGKGWQRQHHIYTSPFYYIDYCLAQTVALAFWAMIREDPGKAWEKYMAYTVQGGSDTFVHLLEKAGLENPFDEKCLSGIAKNAQDWLDKYDLPIDI